MKNTKKLLSILAVMLWVGMVSDDSLVRAADSRAGSTRGIIDVTEQARPAGAKQLVGKTGYDLVPESDVKCQWIFKEGVLTASPAWDSVITRESYRDFRLHVEFNVNQVPGVDSEKNGNSGIYIQQRYEVQILNSYGVSEADYTASYCGSLYRMKKPDKRVNKPAGQWQSFDIAFRAARFDGDKKIENARITVYQNQQLIHDDVSMRRQTGAGKKEGPDPRPIKLQGHHNQVRFRNVWVQALPLDNKVVATEGKPNIVVILADDMGIDSVAALNEKCGIPTPHLDRLLKQGMHFTDAHSGSAVCSPTRYGLLTGRYSWRSRLKRGIVGQWERPLIENDRLTLPGMLKQEGYSTACIGKWHLGWHWPKKEGGFTNKLKEVDFSKPTGGGPTTAGFDHYFGDDVPNWPPFVWIEDDTTQGIPDTQLTFAKHYYSNNGIGVEGWTLEQVLPKITEKSVAYINSHASRKEPFFLYFPMTSPHTPIAPSKQFLGKSGISPYADLLMQTDWCVGQVLNALKANNVADNTVVIFTGDNGTSPKCDFEGLREKNTELQNHWRGMKTDGYEGGHRVPFIVRWPGKILPGTKSDQTISLVDIMATCADAAGVTLPDIAAEDSVNLMPTLRGEKVDGLLHEAVICHSVAGVFVVRKGHWKLQFSAGSGGWSLPKDNEAIQQGLPKWQLYNLSTDPKETENQINHHPEVVRELTEILRGFIEKGRSTPGAPQKNHGGAIWWKGLPWGKGDAALKSEV